MVFFWMSLYRQLHVVVDCSVDYGCYFGLLAFPVFVVSIHEIGSAGTLRRGASRPLYTTAAAMARSSAIPRAPVAPQAAAATRSTHGRRKPSETSSEKLKPSEHGPLLCIIKRQSTANSAVPARRDQGEVPAVFFIYRPSHEPTYNVPERSLISTKSSQNVPLLFWRPTYYFNRAPNTNPHRDGRRGQVIAEVARA